MEDEDNHLQPVAERRRRGSREGGLAKSEATSRVPEEEVRGGGGGGGECLPGADAGPPSRGRAGPARVLSGRVQRCRHSTSA